MKNVVVMALGMSVLLRILDRENGVRGGGRFCFGSGRATMSVEQLTCRAPWPKRPAPTPPTRPFPPGQPPYPPNDPRPGGPKR